MLQPSPCTTITEARGLWSRCIATREATIMRSPRTPLENCPHLATTRESPMHSNKDSAQPELIHSFKTKARGCPAVLRFRLWTPDAGGTCLIPGEGTKIPHAPGRHQMKEPVSKTATSVASSHPGGLMTERQVTLLIFPVQVMF